MTSGPTGLLELFRTNLRHGRIFDLGHTLSMETPHHPAHVPFLYRLTKEHGDMVYPGGVSAANDMFVMGAHVGTHIDGLGHIAEHGKLHGGMEAHCDSVARLGIDLGPPILCRGVLLDLAGQEGGCLPAGHEVTIAEIEQLLARQKTELRPDDCVLIRTGWSRFLSEPRRFVGLTEGLPGPGLAAARWLAERGMGLAGSDTMIFERTPAPDLPVHVELIVRRGIRIMECLALDELAAAGIHEFIFIALPLKIRGATGSPIRPVAVC